MNRKLNTILKTSFGVILLASTFIVGNVNNVYAKNLNIVRLNNNKELPKPTIQNKMGSFYETIESYNISPSEFSSNLTNWFGFDDNHTFELIREYNDELGYTHQNFQHYYKGIPVENDIVFLHIKEGKVQAVNGQVVSIGDIDANVSLSDAEVIAIAMEDFGTRENVQQSEILTYISKIQKKDGEVQITATKKINLISFLPVKNEFYYINSQGEIVNQFQNVFHADVQGSGATYYRGTQNITVDSNAGQYRLKDNARNIITYNGANASLSQTTGDISGAVDYTNASTAFTSAALKPAVEVHWAMGKTYDYYMQRHNRRSFDNNGIAIKNYYNVPSNFAGGWDQQNAVALQMTLGTTDKSVMVYGTGGSLMNPVVGLDVAGHEYSHLIINRNGNGGLNYQGESGALNESFADMFGASIEFYANINPNWTIGEGIMKPVVTPAYMRNMSNPNAASADYGLRQPDTYRGTYWASTTSQEDYGGVHTNSGVSNFWFYLLSDTGIHRGTNDIGNTYYVAGIGVAKAEKIAYRALHNGLTASATFNDAFNATKQAAVALYGAGSNEYNQVVNAWYAVGIGTAQASVEENDFKAKLVIYPNPTKGGGTVNIDSQIDDNTTVQFYDLLGKQVSQTQDLNKGNNVLDISYLSAGVYQLVFKADGKVHTEKLIKN